MTKLTKAEIRKLVKLHPLPDGVQDAVLNRAELAEFLNTSPNTVSQWLRDGLPALRMGTNGQAYEFKASQCWAWKKHRDALDQAERTTAQEAITAIRLHLTGGKGGDSIEALPPKERREIYELQAAHEKWLRERNQTLPREEVEDLVEQLMRLFRDGVTAFADMMERRAKLSPEQTETLLGSGDDFLEEMQQTISRYFEAKPVNNEPERTSLFQ